MCKGLEFLTCIGGQVNGSPIPQNREGSLKGEIMKQETLSCSFLLFCSVLFLWF